MKQHIPIPEGKEVEPFIREIAKEEGVDPSLAVRVAEAESTLQPMAVNVNTNGSIDRGLYQFNDKFHPEITDECAYTVECATRAFCKAVKEGHLSWWNASKEKWEE